MAADDQRRTRGFSNQHWKFVLGRATGSGGRAKCFVRDPSASGQFSGSDCRNYQVGTASFGPALSPAGTTADIVQTIPTDGCSPITNSVSGKIALIDRGSCNFVVKTKNAQNAGASSVIIVDNVSNPTPPGLGGTDNTITISTVSVTLANGNTIKAQLTGGVNATLFADTALLAGADANRRPLLFAPNPLQSGSSVSHLDTSGLPNQLMEPNISGDRCRSSAAARPDLFVVP